MLKLRFFIYFLLVSFAGISQNLERYNWYFGNSTQAIRFNRTSAVPSIVSKGIPFGGGGSSTASDPSNANLLFYTDGSRVLDISNLSMPNGGGLLGNTASNQPTAICPVPGVSGKYFLFSNSASYPTAGTITVSVVDMNLFGNALFPAPALGDLESKNLAVAGLPNRAEGMTIIPHANGTDFWLITQLISSTTFTATLINAGSYTGPTFTHTATTISSIPNMAAANFAYHEGKKKIAVSAQDTNTDAIILDFNPATGAISFDRLIRNTGKPVTGNQSIYDIEWSVKGDFLYVSRFGETGIAADLLQYDYLNPTTTLATVLPSPVFRSFGVQMGPDSMIYHLYQTVSAGPVLLGRITKTDTIATQVQYKTSQLTSTGFNGSQFTSFAPRGKANLLVDFDFIGTCQNNNTTFFPKISPGADSIRWNFGDQTSSRDWSPVHKYGQAQTFNASLTAFYQGQSQMATKPVTITAFTLQLNLVQDTTACSCELPFPKKPAAPCNPRFSVTVKVQSGGGGGGANTFLWSNGETTATLHPDSIGYYYVKVGDGSGCFAYAGVNVKEYTVQDQRTNVWYFGQNAGIDFNTLPNPPIPLSNSAMNAEEGCAIICDRNGRPIFYTDGNTVYDKNDAVLATGIGGDPLDKVSQSSIIVPVAGDETLYYIFTNEAIDGGTNIVKYSLFDLKAGPTGAVVKQNLTLFAKSTERITANGKWIVIHEYGNNTFRVYPFSGAGIGEPVLTAIGSDHRFTNPSEGEGYMKLGPKNTIAVALSQSPTTNLVELFHLNDTTGKVTNYRKITLDQSGGKTGQVYGIEFSPGGNKVFATLKGANSQVYEYSIDSIGHPHFKQRLEKTGSELGAIQIAPDGQLYMAINNSAVLGTIQANDDTTRLSTVNFSGFNLAAGTTSRLGLPNFLQQINNAFGGPDFTFSGLCLGDSTKFSGTPTDAIDEFSWFFGDGSSDITNKATPSHLYALAQTYIVTMKLTNRCVQKDPSITIPPVIKNVTINQPPAKPSILPGSLCAGPIILDANIPNAPGLTYLWSNGATTKTLTISQLSIISVTNTDTNGCTSFAQVVIGDSRPQVELGPNQTLCQNSLSPVLDAMNPGATYTWILPSGGGSTSQTEFVDTSIPGTYTYSVKVDYTVPTSPPVVCSTSDQVTFTVVASPSFNFTGIDPTGPACPGTNGSLQLQLLTTAPATGPYSYSIIGPATSSLNNLGFDQAAPSTLNFGPTFTITDVIPAGTYTATVTDQISGCQISNFVGLSNSAFTATPTISQPCDPVQLTINSPGAALPVQYTIINNSTSVPTTGNSSSISFPVNLPSQGPNTVLYTVEVKDAGGCISTTNNFSVTPDPQVPVTVTPNACATPPVITVSSTDPGPVTYAWTGPGIVTSPPTGASIIISGKGQQTYTLVASSPSACPSTTTQTVTLDNVTADFTQSDPCKTTVTLTATPSSSSFSYRWYRNSSTSVSDLGPTVQLTTADDGTKFQSEIFSTLSGCAYKSNPPKTVNVAGQVNAALSATPACDDNKPFTITATTAATNPTFTWYKNNTVIAGLTTSSIDQTDAGTYKVDVTKATCKATSQITITKAPLPVGNLPNRAIICNDPENKDPKTNQVDLDPGLFSKYAWFKNDLDINYHQQIYTATSQGKYRVEITNSFGCVAPDETDVRNECLPKIDVPNAFRPSSAITENKEFYIFSFFITDNFQVFIYNRWGELVYSSSDRHFKWNGGLNNSLSQPLPGGSYAYVIKYVSEFHPERGVQEKRGGVALLR